MKRVLFADNNRAFLEARAEFLTDAGYQVIKAGSPEEARLCFENTWFHLAILDIRMVDDNDQYDTSGLELAMDPKFAAVPKIILTNFSSFEYVRRALGLSDQGMQPAVDFIGKDEEIDIFLKALERAFTHHVRVNFDLEIHPQEKTPAPFVGLLGHLLPKAPLMETGLLAAELEDLFRRLFFESHQILLGRTLWHTDGCLGLEVTACDHDRWQEQFLVVLGGPEVHLRQSDGAAELNEWVRIRDHTEVNPGSSTPHFSAATVQLKTFDLEDCLPFAEFCRAVAPKQAASAVADLLAVYQHPAVQTGQMLPADLNSAWLNSTRNGLQNLTETLPALITACKSFELASITASAENLTFQFPGGQRASLPFPALDQTGLEAALERAWHSRLAPGGLNLNSALLDRSGHVRLTDFMEFHNAPLLVEMAEWELQLRLGLLDEVNLLSLADFERQLLHAGPVGQLIAPEQVEPGCRKALSAVQVLRQSLAGLPEVEHADYLAALLGAVLRQSAGLPTERELTRKETVRWTSLLMLAGLLTQALTRPGPVLTSPQAQSSKLALDAGRSEIVCGARHVRLTPTEFKLLEYFAARPGQVCTREELIHEVFGYPNANDESADRLINTNMDRLRQKIGQVAGKARFIETVRNKGYIFTPEPRT